ncbi:hypothetical protein NKG05_03500 [Oerskovia sp. M15]
MSDVIGPDARLVDQGDDHPSGPRVSAATRPTRIEEASPEAQSGFPTASRGSSEGAAVSTWSARAPRTTSTTSQPPSANASRTCSTSVRPGRESGLGAAAEPEPAPAPSTTPTVRRRPRGHRRRASYASWAATICGTAPSSTSMRSTSLSATT